MNAETKFTLEQVAAILEVEKSLMRHGFAGAKAALQAVYEGLTARARAFSERRLFQVGCDWSLLVPYLQGVRKSDDYAYHAPEQLRGRFQGELLLDFGSISIANPRACGVSGEQFSRKMLMLALIQTGACVLPPSILLAICGFHWDDLRKVLPDGHSVLAWGTVFWNGEDQCVFGVTRKGETVDRSIFVINEQECLPTEHVLLWRK